MKILNVEVRKALRKTHNSVKNTSQFKFKEDKSYGCSKK